MAIAKIDNIGGGSIKGISITSDAYAGISDNFDLVIPCIGYSQLKIGSDTSNFSVKYHFIKTDGTSTSDVTTSYLQYPYSNFLAIPTQDDYVAFVVRGATENGNFWYRVEV